MRNFAPAMVVFCVMAISGEAHAVSWRQRCAEIWKTLVPAASTELTEQELKEEYNTNALATGQARLASIPQTMIPVRHLVDQYQWLDGITHISIVLQLDRYLPMWEQDGDWFFQTLHVIRLYSPRSNQPIQFETNSYILMNGKMATGIITMGYEPTIDLFD